MTDRPGQPEATPLAGDLEPAGGAVIMVCPDGPLLLRGDFVVVDADGQEVPGARRTSALCRCGKSRDKPFCDGTHKAARFRAP